jgi:hypothetical protein
MPHDNPVMFCHDSHSIYYPTGPGRVYAIDFASLADSTGDDADIKARTVVDDLFILSGVITRAILPKELPDEWVDAGGLAPDFDDCLEQWADWCDRDSARLDSLDEVKGRIERAA